jgi:hypothetical protein
MVQIVMLPTRIRAVRKAVNKKESIQEPLTGLNYESKFEVPTAVAVITCRDDGGCRFF